MTEISIAERERQRFEHLVLERPRPEPMLPAKPAGISRAEWKVRKAALRAKGAELADGIEERVRLRERWSHKAYGTPETHEHANRVARRAGSLARLYATNTIDADQLAAAQEIAETYEAIGEAVGVRASFVTQRVDVGFRPELAGGELSGRVWRELTYDRWRGDVDGPVGAVLAMVVHDGALTAVAREYRISDRRMRSVLVEALNLWNRLCGRPVRRGSNTDTSRTSTS